ncbi:Protein eva-1-like C [Exaiptasia diaphana]|nr:Protein eva-1-like C [Exaiptasia diaphana]
MRKTSKSVPYYIVILIIVGILTTRKCVANGMKSMMACENGMMYIKCPHNTLQIQIAQASYGRELSKKFVCQSNDPNVVIKDCGVSNVKSRVQKKCDGKYECNFKVDNQNLGYFCTNVYKYLIVLFDCIGLK